MNSKVDDINHNSSGSGINLIELHQNPVISN